MSEQGIITFADIAKMIAKKYNVPTEIVEDILISFLKILYEGTRSEFRFPESDGDK